MERYADYAPAAHDTRGLPFSGDHRDDPNECRQEWLVAGGHNRDSDDLGESNWDTTIACLAECDPDGKDHDVIRFGHWACGWVEIVLVRPDSAAAKEAERIEAALSDYPVLDESDFSEREYDSAMADIEACLRCPAVYNVTAAQVYEWLSECETPRDVCQRDVDRAVAEIRSERAARAAATRRARAHG